jgi:hypothetical protein
MTEHLPPPDIETLSAPPLNEADQAITDTVHMVPEGSDRVGTAENGVRIHLLRRKVPTQDIVIATITSKNGIVKEYTAGMEITPGREHTYAYTHEWLVANSSQRHRKAKCTAAVSGEKVGDGDKPWEQGIDPVKAREIKLEIARKISEAQENLTTARDVAGNPGVQ